MKGRALKYLLLRMFPCPSIGKEFKACEQTYFLYKSHFNCADAGTLGNAHTKAYGSSLQCGDSTMSGQGNAHSVALTNWNKKTYMGIICPDLPTGHGDFFSTRERALVLDLTATFRKRQCCRAVKSLLWLRISYSGHRRSNSLAPSGLSFYGFKQTITFK